MEVYRWENSPHCMFIYIYTYANAYSIIYIYISIKHINIYTYIHIHQRGGTSETANGYGQPWLGSILWLSPKTIDWFNMLSKPTAPGAVCLAARPATAASSASSGQKGHSRPSWTWDIGRKPWIFHSSWGPLHAALVSFRGAESQGPP